MPATGAKSPSARSPIKISARSLSVSSISSKLSLSPLSPRFFSGLNSGSSTRPADSDDVALPAFLRRNKSAIDNAFIDLEWQQRRRLAEGAEVSDPPSQWARTRLPFELASRNRYPNVETFESNRVKIQGVEEADDYINASSIVLGERRYISTQGPKESSASHFYRMVMQQTTTNAVIIMLTQTHEAGREKCWPYFPNEVNGPPLQLRDTAYEPSPHPRKRKNTTENGATHRGEHHASDANGADDAKAYEPKTKITFEGEVTLLAKEEDAVTRSVIRKLRLRARSMRTGGTAESHWEEREIWHLLFGGWPDFSVPEGQDQNALINLVALSQRLNAGASMPESSDDVFDTRSSHARSPVPAASLANPRIVHCSAGVGRSGTFIALDYLLGLLENGELDSVPEDADPIAEVVNDLRKQRMMMVQGESQFHFLYEILREKWTERSRRRQSVA